MTENVVDIFDHQIIDRYVVWALVSQDQLNCYTKMGGTDAGHS